jgi:diguanylate cyclase (GGDEF)-like protein
MGMALIQVPVAPTTRGQRQRIGLDLAAAIVGGGMVIWYLVLAPTIVAGGYTALQLATSIAYPLGDVAILATLAIVLLTWSPPALRRPLGFIVAGLSMFVVADIAYGHALLHDGYTAGGPIDILWIGALTLFAVAAGRQEKVGADAPAASVPERAPIERRVSWLPFGALALGSATLLAAEWGRPFVADFSIVLTAIALAALIAVRQYVTQRQMIRLQLELGAAHDELSDLADHDSLTGLSNRRRIDEDLSREMERAKRYGHRLSVLFLDIDRFKSINDEYGHAVGDAALSEFASLLRDCLRPADLPSRWGGEEFVVILPETGSEEERRTAERIRATAAAHDFSFDETTGLTCSIGVSTFPDGAAEIDSLLKLSDGALLKAKQDGRNRVAVA